MEFDHSRPDWSGDQVAAIGYSRLSISIHSSFWHKPSIKFWHFLDTWLFCKTTQFWKYKHLPGIEQCYSLQHNCTPEYNYLYPRNWSGISMGASLRTRKRIRIRWFLGDRRVHQILTSTTLHDLDLGSSCWLNVHLIVCRSSNTAVIGLTLILHSTHWSVLVLTVFLYSCFFQSSNSCSILISGLFYIAFVWALISCRLY